MKIRLNGKFYNCNTAAITPIRYRSFFGRSFIVDFLKQEGEMKEVLEKLLYISIWDLGLPFSSFQKDCAEDKDFLSSALFVKECIFEYKKDNIQVSTDAEMSEIEFDEFLVLAQMGDCHLPERLLDELSLFQIIEVIKHFYEMKNPQQKPKVLQPKERKAIFGISPEVEARIKKAIGKDEGDGSSL